MLRYWVAVLRSSGVGEGEAHSNCSLLGLARTKKPSGIKELGNDLAP